MQGSRDDGLYFCLAVRHIEQAEALEQVLVCIAEPLSGYRHALTNGARNSTFDSHLIKDKRQFEQIAFGNV